MDIEHLPKGIDGYIPVETIGLGATSVVYKCKSEDDNKIYALKLIKKSNLDSKIKRERIENEISILCSCRHKSIVRLIERIEDDDNLYLITEYCHGISLSKFLEMTGKINERNAQSIIKQLLNALNYLHLNQIAHRDIKPENIIIDTHTLEIKLIDFGFSVRMAKDDLINDYCGSLNYLAPELLLRQPYDPIKADIWSVGVLYYTIIHGCLPWDTFSKESVIESIMKADYELGEEFSPKSKQFLLMTIQKNPNERATALVALNTLRSGENHLKCANQFESARRNSIRLGLIRSSLLTRVGSIPKTRTCTI